jgi:hypothetical protein
MSLAPQQAPASMRTHNYTCFCCPLFLWHNTITAIPTDLLNLSPHQPIWWSLIYICFFYFPSNSNRSLIYPLLTNSFLYSFLTHGPHKSTDILFLTLHHPASPYPPRSLLSLCSDLSHPTRAPSPATSPKLLASLLPDAQPRGGVWWPATTTKRPDMFVDA